MNALIIDIRDTCLRAVLSNDGVLEYCRTFDFEAMVPSIETDSISNHEPALRHAPAADNPYLIYYDTEKKNPWDFALKQILEQIRTDIKDSIDSTHLIIPSNDVIIGHYQIPKMARSDAQKLIGRKISTETKEDFPPFSIIPVVSDQKTQTWCSLYVPSTTLQDYHKAFSSCQMRLSSITTPINAMIDAFRTVREAIFNAHAIFEIQRGFIEAFYISADGILHFQRLSYAPTSAPKENGDDDKDKAQKFKIFKIINTIFSVNSNYQTSHPAIPVQRAWICGLESGLEEIATALKEAMGIEVGIAPAMSTGLPEESGYVPLAGFAAALRSNSATTYATADFFRRFPLHRTSYLIIYAVAAGVALLTITLTELEYRKLKNETNQFQKPLDSKSPNNKAAAASPNIKNLETLKNATSRQFAFYTLFRELATDLPDNVYLENLEFRLKDSKGFVDITAVARLDDKMAENMLLTKFAAMLDRSPILKNHREPVISVVAKDKYRFLKISVTSEVNPFDTPK